MKGCTPSKKSQMSFWRGMCVWGKGHGVGVRVRVDKTIIVFSVGRDRRSGEHQGGCGNTTEGSAHTASVLSSYTLLAKSYSVSQGLIHSGPHLSHLWIPQVLINTTHFQLPSGWCHFSYCRGLSLFLWLFVYIGCFSPLVYMTRGCRPVSREL